MKHRCNKKTTKSIFLICILTTLIIALVGCSSMSKYEDAYNEYEEKFKQIILSDKNQDSYNKYMSDLKSNIDSKNSSKCDKAIESLNSLLEASKSYSISYLDKRQNEMDQKEKQVNLLEAEKSTIENYKSEIEKATSEERYKDAEGVYQKYEAFLDALGQSSNYSLEVSQVDVSEYPTVKLYVSIKDLTTGESIDNLEYEDFYLSENMESSGFKETKIEKAVQLDQEENLTIDIVADVSDSMNIGTSQGTNMSISKQAMVSLVNQIQFNVGDKAGLLSFADNVTRNLYFTDNKSQLINKINNLQMGNMTSLYDALYASVNQIVSTDGAKCIIAFTDGQDNVSRVSYQAVKDLAQRYKVPIYIIGIGSSLNTPILSDIANSTGGFYKNITDASYMAGVYDSIFKEQKSQYLLEYTTSEKSKESVIRNLYIRYMSEKMMTRNTYSYTPEELLEAKNGSAKYNQDGYIFADSDSRYLTISDLEKLSDKELRLARNEIYARNGRRFDDQELQNYFNGCSWYRGSIDPDDFDDERMLNKYERANAYLILEYENLQ
ncbi:MAG: YARHG domain-containing protein [Intestinibacter sp.]|uniref:YARHG domain-containing protein n=1 Tax=Intestinibacter sp. TaxID=1965304 RepID=UPI002A81D506|nr:YARHG domain-containing protein [Intestinibacter sp.]MDY4575532.1 YARHG domain-containing protein [Intestinibacter sp.]